jgi:hypothetical protein
MAAALPLREPRLQRPRRSGGRALGESESALEWMNGSPSSMESHDPKRQERLQAGLEVANAAFGEATVTAEELEAA